MRIGVLGPSEKNPALLREAMEFLLRDCAVDQAIYLADDAAAIDRAAHEWARETLGGDPNEATFLDRAAQLAMKGDAGQIQELLAAEASLRRLSALRVLPPAPARAVELLSDRFVLFVHDKAVLDEEDIANAHLIVYGRAEHSELRRFGTRYFLTPGPLDAGRVAVLEVEGDGQVSIAIFETSGTPVLRETMARRTTKMSVAR
jgi:hypothetical protein